MAAFNPCGIKIELCYIHFRRSMFTREFCFTYSKAELCIPRT